jgi:hypothetical protein
MHHDTNTRSTKRGPSPATTMVLILLHASEKRARLHRIPAVVGDSVVADIHWGRRLGCFPCAIAEDRSSCRSRSRSSSSGVGIKRGDGLGGGRGTG